MKEPALIDAIDATIRGHFQNSEFNFYTLIDMHAISMSRLYAVIKKERNDTPEKYILKFRLDEASRLLFTTTMTSKQVAFATGFGDHMYFMLSFKGRFGRTPDQVSPKLMSRQRIDSI